MTNDKKLNRQSLFAQAAISGGQKVEVFFFRNAADVEQPNLAIRRSEFFKKSDVSSSWMKQFRVEAARQNFQFCRIESAFNPALLVFFGVNENSIKLPIEPMHVS